MLAMLRVHQLDRNLRHYRVFFLLPPQCAAGKGTTNWKRKVIGKYAQG